MEAIIFIGLQAAGKSSFYREKFIDTHIRINLDMLRTRHREQILFNACLEAKQPFVVDNTNPMISDRSHYLEPAKAKKFKTIGYYFESNLAQCQHRNNQRDRSKQIPLVGILATYKKIQLPSYQEKFDVLYYVKIQNNLFIVEKWQDAV